MSLIFHPANLLHVMKVCSIKVPVENSHPLVVITSPPQGWCKMMAFYDPCDWVLDIFNHLCSEIRTSTLSLLRGEQMSDTRGREHSRSYQVNLRKRAGKNTSKQKVFCRIWTENKQGFIEESVNLLSYEINCFSRCNYVTGWNRHKTVVIKMKELLWWFAVACTHKYLW